MTQRSKSHSKKAAYWRRVTREWKRSGQSQAAFCEAKNLKLTTFRWWRHQLLREAAEAAKAKGIDSPASFVPVRIVDTPSSSSPPIEILLSNSRRIQIPPDSIRIPFDACLRSWMSEHVEPAPFCPDFSLYRVGRHAAILRWAGRHDEGPHRPQSQLRTSIRLPQSTWGSCEDIVVGPGRIQALKTLYTPLCW